MRLGKITAKRVRAAFRFCKLYVREAVDDVRLRAPSSSSGGAASGGGAMTVRDSRSADSEDRRHGRGGGGAGGASSPARAEPKRVARPQVHADLSPALRALCDANDREGAYAELKAVHPKARAIADDLALLKSKIVGAKATAGRVNSARGRIKGLKKEIEQLRVAARMADGGGGAPDDAADGPVEGEAELIAAIDDAKREYHGGFDELRGLKSDTQGIQAQIERTRAKMREDFESVWLNRRRREREPAREPARAAAAAARAPVRASPPRERERERRSLPAVAPRSGGGGSDGSSGGATALARTVRRDGGHDIGRDIGVEAWGSDSTRSESRGESRGSGGSGGRIVGGGSKVNDDIMAFYAARDELQRRRGGGARK
jgi:hypothetical protein